MVCTQFVITWQPWQPLLQTKFREAVRRIKGLDLQSKFIFVQPFHSREGRNTLAFLSSHQFVQMNSDFPQILHSVPCRVHSGLTGKNIGINQFKMTPPLCPRKTLEEVNDFSLSWKSLVKGYGLNLIGKRKHNCDNWCSCKGSMNPGTAGRSPESNLI